MNFLASSDESRNNADYGIEQEQELSEPSGNLNDSQT